MGFFFFQAEEGIRGLVRSRGLGDGYKRKAYACAEADVVMDLRWDGLHSVELWLSLILI